MRNVGLRPPQKLPTPHSLIRAVPKGGRYVFSAHVLYAIVMASVTLQVSPAWAKTVKCDQGKSLQTAIDNASEGDEIDVTGTCNEFIVFDITQHFLTLLGAPGAAIVSSDPGRPTIDVNQARRITISGFSISGGARGVMIRNGQAVLANNSISGSVRGVEARNNSGAILLNNMISDACCRNRSEQQDQRLHFWDQSSEHRRHRFPRAFRLLFFVLDLAITGSPGRAIVVADNSAGTISGLNIALDSVRPGIEVDSGGSLKVDNANILSATLSSREEGFLRLSGVTLDGGGSPGAGITADGGSVHLSNGSVVGFEQAVFAADLCLCATHTSHPERWRLDTPWESGWPTAHRCGWRVAASWVSTRLSLPPTSASVQLTDVTLDGGGSTRQGIGVAAGGSVRMEGGSIVGFQTGLFASHSANARLTDVTLNGGGSSGFGIESASGGSSVWLENSSVQGFDFGGVASDGSFVEVNGSNVVGDIRGLWVTGGHGSRRGGKYHQRIPGRCHCRERPDQGHWKHHQRWPGPEQHQQRLGFRQPVERQPQPESGILLQRTSWQHHHDGGRLGSPGLHAGIPGWNRRDRHRSTGHRVRAGVDAQYARHVFNRRDRLPRDGRHDPGPASPGEVVGIGPISNCKVEP